MPVNMHGKHAPLFSHINVLAHKVLLIFLFASLINEIDLCAVCSSISVSDEDVVSWGKKMVSKRKELSRVQFVTIL